MCENKLNKLVSFEFAHNPPFQVMKTYIMKDKDPHTIIHRIKFKTFKFRCVVRCTSLIFHAQLFLKRGKLSFKKATQFRATQTIVIYPLLVQRNRTKKKDAKQKMKNLRFRLGELRVAPPFFNF